MSKQSRNVRYVEDDDGWTLVDTSESSEYSEEDEVEAEMRQECEMEGEMEGEVEDLLSDGEDDYVNPHNNDGVYSESKEVVEECEGEKEIDDEEALIRKQVQNVPEKVKEIVLKVLTLGADEQTRNEMKGQIEEELMKHAHLYAAACAVVIEGSVKLTLACRQYIECFDECLDATSRAVKRYRKLRKFKKRCNLLQKRINHVKVNFFETIEQRRQSCENTSTSPIVTIFEEIQEIKTELEMLLSEISKYKKNIKWKRGQVNKIVLASLGTGAIIFGGGCGVVVLGAGSIGAIFLTDGLSIPVSACLYATAGVGMLTGLLACTVTLGSGVCCLTTGAIENISSGIALKKAKKMQKRVRCMKKYSRSNVEIRYENGQRIMIVRNKKKKKEEEVIIIKNEEEMKQDCLWWNDTIKLIEQVEKAEKNRNQAIEDMLSLSHRRFIHPKKKDEEKKEKEKRD